MPNVYLPLALLVLATAIGLAVILYIPLLRLLIHSKKREAKIISEAKDKADQFLSQAHQESLAIIKDSHTEARAIIFEANRLKLELEQQFNENLSSVTENFITELRKDLAASEKEYRDEFTSTLSKSIEIYKTAVKDFYNMATAELKKINDSYTQDSLDSKKSLDTLTTEGLKEIQSRLEEYERQQKLQIASHLQVVAGTAIEKLIGKSLTPANHEEIILKILEEEDLKNAESH